MATSIHIDTRDAIKKIEAIQKKFSKQQLASVARISLNTAARKGKTEFRKSISELYNIKPSSINDADKKKGLSLKLATNSNLSAEVDAGHKPLSLANFPVKFKSITLGNRVKVKDGKFTKGKAIKRSIGQISVSILSNKSKIIPSAFIPGIVKHSTGQIATPAIFARGKRGKPNFSFSKKRYPIDTISSVSIATAALNKKERQRIENAANESLSKETDRQINRLLNQL